MEKIFWHFAIATLLVACSSTPVPETAPISPAPSTHSDRSVVQDLATSPRLSELDDPTSPLSKRSVYFPYDAFAVDPQYSGMLTAHAAFLSRHRDLTLTLEGNADERGSSEYNLALGQKRAEAVRRAMLMGGAGDKQIEAISYGKERPKAPCHEERCWRENRRADLVYRRPDN